MLPGRRRPRGPPRRLCPPGERGHREALYPGSAESGRGLPGLVLRPLGKMFGSVTFQEADLEQHGGLRGDIGLSAGKAFPTVVAPTAPRGEVHPEVSHHRGVSVQPGQQSVRMLHGLWWSQRWPSHRPPASTSRCRPLRPSLPEQRWAGHQGRGPWAQPSAERTRLAGKPRLSQPSAGRGSGSRWPEVPGVGPAALGHCRSRFVSSPRPTVRSGRRFLESPPK